MRKKHIENACRPRGLEGRLTLRRMNRRHASMAAWGFSHLDLPRDAKTLDIGCGGGANLAELLRRSPAGHVTGIDYSEVSVKKSSAFNKEAIRAGRCSVLQGNVLDLPFPDGSFDAVTAFETVYFWPEIGKALQNVRRVLKEGGVFLLCNETDGKSGPGLHWADNFDGMTVYTEEELTTLLKAAGFSRVASDTSEHGWLCFVCRK